VKSTFASLIGVFGVFCTLTTTAQTGVWNTNVAAISPRAFGAAATVGGKVYMAGGGTYSCGVNSILQAYDPATNVWVSLANMPSARYEFGAAELNGQFYAIGGNTGCGSPMRQVEAYNPVSNSWSSKALLPTAGWGVGVASVNGKIYVIGGVTNYVYCYDPAGNSWSQKSPVPAPSYAFGAVAVVNGIIYVIGGVGSPSGVFAYNPVADSWAVKASLPTSRNQGAAAALNGIIYVAGGNNSTGVVAAVAAYDTTTDAWSTVAPLPFRVYAASAAAINGRLYVMGGFDVNNATIGSVAVFTPPPVLTNIVVTPINPIIGIGTNQPFTATGNYDDGSSLVLTNGGPGSLWSSSSPTVAAINTNGLATGLTDGVTTITATSGSVSNNTTLTVVSPPAIATQPANHTVSPNGSVTLSVSATGGSLSYQWQFNGADIAGATGGSLTIANVTATNIGVYAVIVNNAAGSVISSFVTLASVDIKMFAGVIVNGPLGSNYLIQASASLLNGWTTLTNVALPTQPYIYIDYSSPTNTAQFYRATPQ
jgi:hypothetical protein